MSNLNVELVYREVDFVNEYEVICKNYNDFDNSLSGNNPEIYSSIISKLGYKAKYYKKEAFYRIQERKSDLTFGFQLTLKNGMVEIMIDTKFNDVWCVPDGRMDFLCKQIDPNFDRDEYNLPKYTSHEDLENILNDLFKLYEKFKIALIKYLEVA